MAPVNALYERSRETCFYAESRLEGELDRPAAAGGGGVTDYPAGRETAGASFSRYFLYY